MLKKSGQVTLLFLLATGTIHPMNKKTPKKGIFTILSKIITPKKKATHKAIKPNTEFKNIVKLGTAGLIDLQLDGSESYSKENEPKPLVQEEDLKDKSPEEILDIYLNSVIYLNSMEYTKIKLKRAREQSAKIAGKLNKHIDAFNNAKKSLLENKEIKEKEQENRPGENIEKLEKAIESGKLEMLPELVEETIEFAPKKEAPTTDELRFKIKREIDTLKELSATIENCKQKIQRIKPELEKVLQTREIAPQYQCNLLNAAVDHGLKMLYDRLMGMGAQAHINTANAKGLKLIHRALAAVRKNRLTGLKILNDLLSRPELDVNTKNLDGGTILHTAVMYLPLCYADTLEHLIKNYKLDINATDQRGNTPLHYAAFLGNTLFLNILINHGAKVDVLNKFDTSPLHMATVCGYLENISLLHAQGAKIDRAGGCESVEECEIELGLTNTDQQHETSTKSTPLHAAAGALKLEIVSYLLKQGANPLATDGNGRTVRALLQKNSDNNLKVLATKQKFTTVEQAHDYIKTHPNHVRVKKFKTGLAINKLLQSVDIKQKPC